jgi:hypothetical protein
MKKITSFKSFLLLFACTLCICGGLAELTSCSPVAANPGGTIKYPFGKASVVSLTATGSQAISISNSMTVIDGATIQGTGNRTLVLTVDPQLPIGAYILVTAKTDSIRTTTFSTGFLAPVITGVATKTKSQGFLYDGTYFRPTGTAVQDN